MTAANRPSTGETHEPSMWASYFAEALEIWAEDHPQLIPHGSSRGYILTAFTKELARALGDDSIDAQYVAELSIAASPPLSVVTDAVAKIACINRFSGTPRTETIARDAFLKLVHFRHPYVGENAMKQTVRSLNERMNRPAVVTLSKEEERAIRDELDNIVEAKAPRVLMVDNAVSGAAVDLVLAREGHTILLSDSARAEHAILRSLTYWALSNTRVDEHDIDGYGRAVFGFRDPNAKARRPARMNPVTHLRHITTALARPEGMTSVALQMGLPTLKDNPNRYETVEAFVDRLVASNLIEPKGDDGLVMFVPTMLTSTRNNASEVCHWYANAPDALRDRFRFYVVAHNTPMVQATVSSLELGTEVTVRVLPEIPVHKRRAAAFAADMFGRPIEELSEKAIDTLTRLGDVPEVSFGQLSDVTVRARGLVRDAGTLLLQERVTESSLNRSIVD